MAGEVTKEELGTILVQAMLAAKNIRPQLDLLLQLRRRLEQQPRPSDDNVTAGILEFALDVEHVYPGIAARFNDIAGMALGYADVIKHLDLGPEIFKVYFAGVRAGARAIHTCLQTGGRLALNPSFAAMPDEELYNALVAQQLPARPTTQTEALDRVEAAFFALKLSREHHLPRCVEHLGGSVRPPLLIGEPENDSSENEDDPADAATDDLAKIDHSDPAPATAATEHRANTDLSDPAPAAATGEPTLASFKSRMDHDKACTYLDRACTLWSLAVEHTDLAVAVFSSFLDPKEVASLSDYTDRVAYTESDGPSLFILSDDSPTCASPGQVILLALLIVGAEL